LICGILDTNKIEDVDKIKDIKKRIDLLTLNQLCSNIRMYTYLYDNNTGQVIGSNLVGSNNFTSITVPVDASGTPTLNSYMYGSYLPMLRVSLFGFSQVLAIQTEKVANVDCTKLNFPFEVGNVNSSTYNIVRLYLDDNNQQSNRGGYKIKISKKCKGDTEKILYLYVGNDPPDFKPGEGDSVLVDNIDLFKKNNTFNIPSNKSGNVYFGIKDIKNNNYADNIGYFTLEASTSKQAKPILSNAIRSVRNQILRIMYGHNVVSDDGTISNNISENDGSGAVGTVYKGIIGSTFKNTIQALILLYITVYSILFLIGAFKAPQLEFVVLLLKIGVVAILLSDNSWRFFNETLFSLFIDGTTELINIMSGPAIETTSSDGKVQSVVDFYFLDRLLGKFAIGQTWLQIFSLLFAGPVGWLIMLAIFWGLWELLCAVFNATINYFMSIIMVALLICLAPIFISLIFFKRTKSIFDSWIKNLAQVATLPSIIFAALALISNAMDGILYTLFNFDICPGCVIEPKIDLSIDTFSFCLLEVLLPLGFSPLNTVHDNIGSTYDGVGFMGIPISLAALIAFVILGHSLSAFVQHGTNIAMNIFGAFGANLSQTAGQFNDSIQTIFGKDRASQGQKMSQEHSKGLDKAKEPPKSVQRD
jgi:type IV secretion system protein VirB6